MESLEEIAVQKFIDYYTSHKSNHVERDSDTYTGTERETNQLVRLYREGNVQPAGWLNISSGFIYFFNGPKLGSINEGFGGLEYIDENGRLLSEHIDIQRNISRIVNSIMNSITNSITNSIINNDDKRNEGLNGSSEESNDARDIELFVAYFKIKHDSNNPNHRPLKYRLGSINNRIAIRLYYRTLKGSRRITVAWVTREEGDILLSYGSMIGNIDDTIYGGKEYVLANGQLTNSVNKIQENIARINAGY